MREGAAGPCETKGVAYPSDLPALAALYPRQKLRTAVIEGELFSVALDWQRYRYKPHGATTAHDAAPPIYKDRNRKTDRVLVLNTANYKHPGGEWLGGVLGLGGEESLARRSTLAQTLTTYSNLPPGQSFYPLRDTKGIYSPDVIVFRDGPETEYRVWDERAWGAISMVSVAPCRRPKTDPDFTQYSFEEEEMQQREKMKAILRIAAMNGHVNLILTPFGSGHKFEEKRTHSGHGATSGDSSASVSAGSAYANPTARVAKMWHELLFEDPEFRGYFSDVVFVITAGDGDHHNWFRGMALSVYQNLFG